MRSWGGGNEWCVWVVGLAGVFNWVLSLVGGIAWCFCAGIGWRDGLVMWGTGNGWVPMVLGWASGPWMVALAGVLYFWVVVW